jgi:hypothetical protein
VAVVGKNINGLKTERNDIKEGNSYLYKNYYYFYYNLKFRTDCNKKSVRTNTHARASYPMTD